MNAFRILVTGSRRFDDAQAVREALAAAIAGIDGPVTVVHGGATGADELAAVLAPTFGPHVTCERWPADWPGPCRAECRPGHRRARRDGSTYCPAAGNYRNQAMVDAGAQLALAFPIGESPGTRDCVRRAAKAGIPTTIHEGEANA